MGYCVGAAKLGRGRLQCGGCREETHMNTKTLESACAEISGGYADPATIIEEPGVMREMIDPLLDTLVDAMPKTHQNFYDPDKTEALIRRFYKEEEGEFWAKLLDWFFFMEEERAARLVIELSKSWQGPAVFRRMSRLVFKWLRKKNAPWYWSIPEFREYVVGHLVRTYGEKKSLPRYLEDDYEASWPTFQRAAWEIVAQRDISMEDVISDVHELLVAGDIPATADSEEVRRLLKVRERSCFMKGIKDTLSLWTEKPREPEISLDSVYTSFTTSNPDGDIAMGEECTFIVHVYGQSDEEWRDLKGCVVPALKLESVETVTDEDISPIPWSAFKPIGERRGDTWQDRECRISLRLTSPVGRVHLSFRGDGQEVRHDAGYYIGDVPKWLNAAWLMREK